MNTDLADKWRAALAPLVVRHPDRRCKPVVEVRDGDPPTLYVGLDRAWSTAAPKNPPRQPFAISNVALTYFPGDDLARKWFAAAWAGYLMHEGLELVTVGDLETRPLDPHEDPYQTNPYNRCLRDGFPPTLDAVALYRALQVVMCEWEAARLTWKGAPNQ